MVVGDELPRVTHVLARRLLRETPELQVLSHSITQLSHGSSPVRRRCIAGEAQDCLEYGAGRRYARRLCGGRPRPPSRQGFNWPRSLPRSGFVQRGSVLRAHSARQHQCLVRRPPLTTMNVRDFRRFQALMVERWSSGKKKPKRSRFWLSAS
jgi:hypothetical protein